MKRAIFHFQIGFRKGYSTAQHASEIAGKQYADILYIVVRKYIGFSKVFILSATNIVEETIIIWKQRDSLEMIHKSYLEQDAVCSHRPYRITEARMTCVGFAYSLELFKVHEFPRLFPRTCPVFHDLTFSCQLSKIFKTHKKRKNKTVFPDFSRLTIKFSD